MLKTILKLTIGFAMFLGVSAAQEAEVRIGALNPLTGAGSPYGPGMQQAIQLAVDEINAAGGINGAMVRLFTEDSQTEPEPAVRAAQKLIEVNRVDAILGTWSSSVTMAVAPLTIEAGVIEMNTSGAPEISTLDDNDLVWRTQASNVLFGEVFARVTTDLGLQRASTMAFNNPSGRGNTEEFARVFKEMGGEILSEVVYNPDQSTYRAELEQALGPNPEIIVLGSYLPDTTIILKEWFQLFGDEVTWIGPAWAINSDLVEALGAQVVEGIYAVDAVPNVDSPTYENFVNAFEEATGSSPSANPYAPMVYDQMISLALAMVAADSTDPIVAKDYIQDVTSPPGEEVHSFAEGVDALGAGEEINYEGASSRIDFDKNGDVRPNFGLYQVSDGSVELVQTIELD
jgi:branched-chain amino acid transport system substrate-binding protein